MGFFDRVFASSKGYPTLDESSPVADRINRLRDHLESLSKQVHKPLEVVPMDDDGCFVFIGKPPKDFGIAWIEGDKLHSLKSLADEQGVSTEDLKAISESLRKIYEANQDNMRFTTKVGRKNIVVTPSEELSAQVSNVIHQATH